MLCVRRPHAHAHKPLGRHPGGHQQRGDHHRARGLQAHQHHWAGAGNGEGPGLLPLPPLLLLLLLPLPPQLSRLPRCCCRHCSRCCGGCRWRRHRWSRGGRPVPRDLLFCEKRHHMPVALRCACTAALSRAPMCSAMHARCCQWLRQVTRGGEETKMRGKGRHDPCVLPRAVPMVSAAARSQQPPVPASPGCMAMAHECCAERAPLAPLRHCLCWLRLVTSCSAAHTLWQAPAPFVRLWRRSPPMRSMPTLPSLLATAASTTGARLPLPPILDADAATSMPPPPPLRGRRL
jgi:Chorismate synthase